VLTEAQVIALEKAKTEKKAHGEFDLRALIRRMSIENVPTRECGYEILKGAKPNLPRS
jgi:hypothetical protein